MAQVEGSGTSPPITIVSVLRMISRAPVININSRRDAKSGERLTFESRGVGERCPGNVAGWNEKEGIGGIRPKAISGAIVCPGEGAGPEGCRPADASIHVVLVYGSDSDEFQMTELQPHPLALRNEGEFVQVDRAAACSVEVVAVLLDVDDSACFRPSAKSSQTKRRGTTEHASVLHSNAPRVLTETEGGQRDTRATIGQTPVRAPGESYSDVIILDARGSALAFVSEDRSERNLTAASKSSASPFSVHSSFGLVTSRPLFRECSYPAPPAAHLQGGQGGLGIENLSIVVPDVDPAKT